MNSPTARLLRSSRLFSLPTPLPPYPLETLSANGGVRSSDTATQPYPTHQAISTPRSSQYRGDWGFKRPLPGRAIPKNTPHIRVHAIDNQNHITDFASAANHTQTVAKWQTLNIPLTVKTARDSISGARGPRVSVFENTVDNTAVTSSDPDTIAALSAERAILMHALLPQQSGKRWKTDGPWVNALSEPDFERYLAQIVRKHKQGFIDYLAHVKREQKKTQIRETLRQRGMQSDEETFDPLAADLELEQASVVSPNELRDFIRALRESHQEDALSSNLSQYVRQYFDLPAFNLSSASSSTNALHLTISASSAPSSEPLSTHPSAGLGYLRSDAFMENHPLYGPQLHHTPVESRVLKSRDPRQNDYRASLGIAGFVTDEGESHSGINMRPHRSAANLAYMDRHQQNMAYLDLETPGGNKVWLTPNSAHVDEKGRVRVLVSTADEGAVGVKLGNPIEAPAPESAHRLSSTLDLKTRPAIRERGFENVRSNGNQDTDLNLIDQLYKSSRPRS